MKLKYLLIVFITMIILTGCENSSTDGIQVSKIKVRNLISYDLDNSYNLTGTLYNSNPTEYSKCTIYLNFQNGTISRDYELQLDYIDPGDNIIDEIFSEYDEINKINHLEDYTVVVKKTICE